MRRRMHDRLHWLAVAGLCLWVMPVVAADRFGAPYDLAWGMELAAVPHDPDVENNGVLSDALLDLGLDWRLVHSVTGVFCAGVGLQQLRIVTPRFDTFDAPREYRRRLRDMTDVYGPPDRAASDLGAAYWSDRVMVESHRGSKTKFYLLVVHNGPEYAACAERQAALTN